MREEHLLSMSDTCYWQHVGWCKVMVLQIEAALHAANFTVKNVTKNIENKNLTRLKK